MQLSVILALFDRKAPVYLTFVVNDLEDCCLDFDSGKTVVVIREIIM